MVTSSSSSFARDDLAPEAGPLDPPEQGKLARVARIEQHRDASELREGLHHQHAREGRAAGEVPGEERLVIRQLPVAGRPRPRFHGRHLGHEEERRSVRQDVGGSGKRRRRAAPALIGASPGRFFAATFFVGAFFAGAFLAVLAFVAVASLRRCRRLLRCLLAGVAAFFAAPFFAAGAALVVVALLRRGQPSFLAVLLRRRLGRREGQLGHAPRRVQPREDERTHLALLEHLARLGRGGEPMAVDGM